MNQKELKREAAKKALDYLDEGVLLGVGTGSTVNEFIDLLPGYRQKIGAVVASSEDTARRLTEIGFQVSELSDVGKLDLYVDGADEANKHFHLIKGGGGALTREKIIAAASRKFVCIIDESKWVAKLGEFPLPVEVIPMAESYISRQFVRLRGQPVVRQGFTTDNGNIVIDVKNLDIPHPPELESRINQWTGVVTVGIFANRPADVILMASEDGVQVMPR